MGIALPVAEEKQFLALYLLHTLTVSHRVLRRNRHKRGNEDQNAAEERARLASRMYASVLELIQLCARRTFGSVSPGVRIWASHAYAMQASGGNDAADLVLWV